MINNREVCNCLPCGGIAEAGRPSMWAATMRGENDCVIHTVSVALTL